MAYPEQQQPSHFQTADHRRQSKVPQSRQPQLTRTTYPHQWQLHISRESHIYG